MIETILASQLLPWVAGLLSVSVGGGILKWILGRIDTENIKKGFGKLMYWAGKGLTLNISEWPYIGKYWNVAIEPWFIVLIQGVCSFGLSEFVRGLRSDND